MDASNHRGIEDARSLRETLMYHHPGRWRVVLLDEAHALTGTAQDALLAVLEEPPSRVALVLMTTDEGRLNETVRSRATRLEFRKLSGDEIRARVTEVAQRERLEIPTGVIDEIVDRADGGMRDALKLLEQAGGARTAEELADALGSRPDGLALFWATVMGDLSGVRRAIEELAASGRNPLDVLIEFTGSLLSPDADQPSFASPRAQRMQDLHRMTSPEDLQRLIGDLSSFEVRERHTSALRAALWRAHSHIGKTFASARARDPHVDAQPSSKSVKEEGLDGDPSWWIRKECPRPRPLPRPLRLKNGSVITKKPCGTSSCPMCYLRLVQEGVDAVVGSQPNVLVMAGMERVPYGLMRDRMKKWASELRSMPMAWHADPGDSPDGLQLVIALRCSREELSDLEGLRGRLERKGGRRGLQILEVHDLNGHPELMERFGARVGDAWGMSQQGAVRRLDEHRELNGASGYHSSRDFHHDGAGKRLDKKGARKY